VAGVSAVFSRLKINSCIVVHKLSNIRVGLRMFDLGGPINLLSRDKLGKWHEVSDGIPLKLLS
jgi:hypothetical protein